MTYTSRKRVEDMAVFHDMSAALYDIPEESGLRAMHSAVAATLRALLDRAERAEAGIAAAAAAEREACALVAEKIIRDVYNSAFIEGSKEHTSRRGGIPWSDSTARRVGGAAIRARGTP